MILTNHLPRLQPLYQPCTRPFVAESATVFIVPKRLPCTASFDWPWLLKFSPTKFHGPVSSLSPISVTTYVLSHVVCISCARRPMQPLFILVCVSYLQPCVSWICILKLVIGREKSIEASPDLRKLLRFKGVGGNGKFIVDGRFEEHFGRGQCPVGT